MKQSSLPSRLNNHTILHNERTTVTMLCFIQGCLYAELPWDFPPQAQAWHSYSENTLVLYGHVLDVCSVTIILKLFLTIFWHDLWLMKKQHNNFVGRLAYSPVKLHVSRNSFMWDKHCNHKTNCKRLYINTLKALFPEWILLCNKPLT